MTTPLTPSDRTTDTPSGGMWQVCRRRWLLGASIVLASWVAGPHVTRMIANRYEATLRLKVEGEHAAVSAFDDVENRSAFGGRAEIGLLPTLCGIIESEQVLIPVADRLRLQDRWARDGQRISMEAVVRRLRNSINARGGRDGNLIDLSVSDTDPILAAAIANTIGEVFRAERQDVRRQQAAAGVESLKQAVAAQERTLHEAQAKVASLHQASGPAGDVVGGAGAEDSERQIAADVTRSQLALSEKTARLDALRDVAFARRYDALAPIVSDAAVGNLAQQLADLDLWITVMGQRYGVEHPQIRDAQTRRDLMARQLDRRLAGLIAGLDIESSTLRDRIESMRRQLGAGREAPSGDASSEKAGFVALRNAQREEDRQARLYESLCDRLQKTTIQLQIPTVPVEIIDRAQVPIVPRGASEAETQSYGLVFGLIIAVAVMWMLESLDTSLKTSSDIEKHLKLSVLGVMPRGIKPLTGDIAPASHLEAYRVLRNNLEFSRVDGPVRSLAVVSAGAGEGKSLTVANLACTYAQAGNRVLVVDTDLRRPTAHTIFGLNNATGVVQVLDGEKTIDDAAQATFVENVSLLASGGANLYGSLIEPRRMATLVVEAAKRYDVILYDTPSVLGVSDAVVVAREVGLTVLVIRPQRYAANAVRRAKQAIDNAGAHLVGAILNGTGDRTEFAASGYQNDTVSFRAARVQAQQSRIAPVPPRGIAA